MTIPIANRGWVGPRACSPQAFRAPEILLGRHFNATVDVWMIGCMTLQMLTGKVPILPRGINQPWTTAYTLAQHHALLGPPPVIFLEQCADASIYWDSKGNWIYPDYDVPELSLESILSDVEDREVARLSLDFVKRCLQWMPQDRASAHDLPAHPFLGQPSSQLWKSLCVKGGARVSDAAYEAAYEYLKENGKEREDDSTSIVHEDTGSKGTWTGGQRVYTWA